jgi:hypothetical protein
MAREKAWNGGTRSAVQTNYNWAENNLPSRAQVKPFDVTRDAEDDLCPKKMGTAIGAARTKSRFAGVDRAENRMATFRRGRGRDSRCDCACATAAKRPLATGA